MAERIVVIGGGYAGLAFIGEARHIPDSQIVLIDPGDGHELIPELPEALRMHDPIEEHVVQFHDVLEGTGVEHCKERVVDIRMDAREVRLSSGEARSFDWLLVSPGSVSAYPPIPGLQERSLPLRNAHDAFKIKERLRENPHQRVVVVGGGLTGVEVAGILAPDHDVWLIEGAPRLLPALGIGLAHYARSRLQVAGVKVIMGQKLERVEENTLKLQRDEIHYDVLIWAGGIQAPRWLRDTDLPLDDRGYPVVDSTGRIGERVFAAGDVWRVWVGHQEVPQTAQLASMAGDYVAESMTRAIRGEPLPAPFQPRLRGMLISLDPGIGVGWVIRGGIPVRGSSARTLKNLSFQQYRLKLSRAFGRGWPF
ncbi:MAG: FAD-dependent oxidoreductase [Firmicutes bacterium]|nr:FAD-dependent oxidoreductase [Bacillota bacterium]